MQPYFLPYIGYWQLIAAADKFVLLDDVGFISRGWINRNKITVNNSPAWLTLPLKKASQNKLIYEIEILEDNGWQSRIRKTLRQSYRNAPLFKSVEDISAQLFDIAQGNLSTYLSRTISLVGSVLDIVTEIIPTSRAFPKKTLKGQDRILDICKQLGAQRYINLPGGKELYDFAKFKSEGIELEFLEAPTEINLQTGLGTPHPLSILDTLMYNTLAGIQNSVRDYKIARNSNEA